MQEQKGKYEGMQNDELGIEVSSNDNPYDCPLHRQDEVCMVKKVEGNKIVSYKIFCCLSNLF